ncbi:chemotaxis protein CheB [Burkholderia stagnalis]|uniref:chemotaxis protein CheB n=1 Tax=Burkholderia stagnalis TaxID=1503054 RepID=UPI000F55E22A|nr:chemotaxis protein CheB [Burkholderia stagnalis]RQQ35782.1 chemotaxis protein CheB [Burkholderia stagnalis]RQQ39440.1 chemotaxis protein CheB [Burkholderia stagnalis]RQQ54782.1 chemotaxis protein CheB [Burkholderia stagnalis]RQY04348.1 chemotaxis protein CheB [Burkholderia stagnalis]RQY17232.1 chemotaxis protein CheB [Burkholderia stagnalis]
MTHRDFIAVGTSSGGVDALRTLVSRLPRDLPATIAIVLHVGAHDSLLPSLLSAAGPLRAIHAEDGETYFPGRIYVAPPDHHLIVEGTHLRLLHGAKENFARPAIDPLFRSVAAEMGPRAIGVILTGLLDDGAAGLDAIQSCGGATIVQDPAEAFAGDMPRHASPYADYVLPLDGLAHRLVELAGNPLDISTTDETARRRASEQVASEQRAWTASEGPPDALSRIASPSTLTCPECGGTLWRLTNSRLLRYRCHTGHAYSAASLAQGRSEDVERTLRDALRALHESETMSRTLGEHFGRCGDLAAQEGQEAAAHRAGEAAKFLQSILLEG